MGTEMEHLSDGELFTLLKSEKKTAGKAFEEIYTRYAQRVFAYCRRILGTREEAEDMFQETFIKFYNSRNDEREMTNLSAYLVKIARNLCINYRRNEKKLLYKDMSAIVQENRDDKDELLNLIKMALELLPDEYREMFVLREYNGLTYSEIANVTETTIQTVKIRLHRAKEKIREILAPYLAEMSK
jgi:RNA polymerase sigma-70 factor (ECF subfamily)